MQYNAPPLFSKKCGGFCETKSRVGPEGFSASDGWYDATVNFDQIQIIPRFLYIHSKQMKLQVGGVSVKLQWISPPDRVSGSGPKKSPC